MTTVPVPVGRGYGVLGIERLVTISFWGVAEDVAHYHRTALDDGDNHVAVGGR